NGKDRAKNTLRLHSLNLRRHLFAITETQQDQPTTNIPPPARHKHRRLEHGGKQDIAKRMALQEPEHRLEREAVLLAKRDDDPVVGRRSLQFEIEGHAESLSQGETPGT